MQVSLPRCFPAGRERDQRSIWDASARGTRSYSRRIAYARPRLSVSSNSRTTTNDRFSRDFCVGRTSRNAERIVGVTVGARDTFHRIPSSLSLVPPFPFPFSSVSLALRVSRRSLRAKSAFRGRVPWGLKFYGRSWNLGVAGEASRAPEKREGNAVQRERFRGRGP